MKILVTGASGHIGNVLVRQLKQKGHNVSVIDRDPEHDKVIQALGVKSYKADITDKASLEEPVKNVDIVYHLAGIIKIMPGSKSLLNKINVVGTKNIVELALKYKINKFIYTSSVHALYEPPKGKRIIEKLANTNDVLGDYAKSKVLATKEVLKLIPKGLNAVVAYPSGVIGPFDYFNSEMGRVIKNYISGKFKYYIDGRYNFVDVRDVANGLIQVLNKGVIGEDYILGGVEISIKKLFDILSSITNIKSPSIKIPMLVAKLIAPLFEKYYKITKKEPEFTTYSIEVLNSNANISSQKAFKQLGYSIRPIKETLKDTVTWLQGGKVSYL